MTSLGTSQPWTAERMRGRASITASGCWMWLGSVDRDGYGRILHGGRYFKAHRVAYEITVGPVPTGLVLDHLCRNRACVNAAHMEPVSIRTNSLRGNSPWARKARQTHCKHGHEFSDKNTRLGRDGTRRCRECARLESAHRRARKELR